MNTSTVISTGTETKQYLKPIRSSGDVADIIQGQGFYDQSNPGLFGIGHYLKKKKTLLNQTAEAWFHLFTLLRAQSQKRLHCLGRLSAKEFEQIN